MLKKIYFSLLIPCVILSQGIVGNEIVLAEESSDILVRQKRVVSLVPGEDRSSFITDTPYIVIIRYKNRIHCVGNILSNYVVITIAQCVPLAASEYTVLSETSRTDRGNPHNVIDIRRHVGGHPNRPEHGIALLNVNPPFIFGAYCFYIELHSAPLIQGTRALIGGWGYNGFSPNRGTCIRSSLRVIVVPIIPHQQCVNIYRPYFEISDKDVCTYHELRHCGDTDGGAPLVVNGQLAGVRLWTQPTRNDANPQFPDVFVVLQDIEYSQWIRTNIHNIQRQRVAQNHHN